MGHFHFFFSPFSIFPEFEKHSKILYGRFGVLVKVKPVFVQLDIFQDLCGTLIIVPEPRRKGALFVFVDFILTISDVKETSSGQLYGPS
jgi:hypothetical protein